VAGLIRHGSGGVSLTDVHVAGASRASEVLEFLHLLYASSAAKVLE